MLQISLLKKIKTILDLFYIKTIYFYSYLTRWLSVPVLLADDGWRTGGLPSAPMSSRWFLFLPFPVGSCSSCSPVEFHLLHSILLAPVLLADDGWRTGGLPSAPVLPVPVGSCSPVALHRFPCYPVGSCAAC